MTQATDLRIRENVRRGAPITLRVDGVPVPGHAGETVATVLLAAGIRLLRTSPTDGGPRGLFCAMGVCQECAVRVDGRVVTACTTAARDGQRVELPEARR